MAFSFPAFSLLLAGGLLLAGCSASPEPTLPLPSATATGANTLGFELDGRTWTTYGQTCYPCRDNGLLAIVGYLPGRGQTLGLSTRLSTPQYQEEFQLQLDSVRGPGTYRCSPRFTGLVSPIPTGFALADNKITDPTQRLAASVAATGSHITLTRVDTVQHIIAGTFEGQLRQSAAPYSVRQVTQGRFDVHY